MDTVLKVHVGSHLHGFATPASDRDYITIHTVDPLWLINPLFNMQASTHEQDGELDVSTHEINKFMALLSRCNPTALEAVHTSKWFVVEADEIGYQLIDNRHLFYDRHQIYATYAGFAKGQVKRFDKGDANPKLRRHALRLLVQGGRFLRQGVLDPTCDDEAVESISEVCTFEPERFMAHFLWLLEALEMSYERSRIPDRNFDDVLAFIDSINLQLLRRYHP